MSGCMVCVWFACECVCVHAYAYVWCACMRVYGVSVNECACVCEFVILYACMDVCVIHALGNTPVTPQPRCYYVFGQNSHHGIVTQPVVVHSPPPPVTHVSEVEPPRDRCRVASLLFRDCPAVVLRRQRR